MHSADDLAAAGRLIAHFLERLPPGWDFLLRSNAAPKGGYMCNIMSPDRTAVMVLEAGRPARNLSEGIYSPAYGPTAVDAVTASASGLPDHVWIGAH